MIEIRAGRARALVCPELGGRVVSLTVDGHEHLAYGGAQTGGDPWRGGSYLLAPWAGRLPSDEVRAGGRVVPVPVGLSRGRPHGFVHHVAWETTRRSDTAVQMRLVVDRAGPWNGECRLSVELDAHRLRMHAVYRAQGAVPVALGFHPWFAREADGEAPRLSFGPRRRIVADADGHESETTTDAPTPRDDLYRADGSTPRLEWRDGRTLDVRSEAGVWVVYERDPLGVCVEPWTHTPGEFCDGTAEVADGAAFPLTMELAWPS